MAPINTQLGNPVSIYVSPINQEVYIADCIHLKIRKILGNGDVVTIAGNGVEGNGGDGGLATDAELLYPMGVFVSPRNEVYIADYVDHKIRKILENGIIVTIAGTGNQGCSGDGGPAIDAQLKYPVSVFVSPNNEVYIADSNNHRIRKILENGNIITIAGNGERGYSGDGGLAINAKINSPTNVFVSSNDEVYFTDHDNHRIRKILESGIIVTIAGTGEQGYSGDGGPAIDAKLSNPYSVFVSPNDEVYFADFKNCRIRKILENGNIITIAGTGEKGYSGDGGLATNALVDEVYSLFVSTNNEVYFADTNQGRIRKILENGNIVTIGGEMGLGSDTVFDISVYPHIGGSLYSSKNSYKLKKHVRDLLFDSPIYAFVPLIELVSPLFCKSILQNEALISLMNSTQQEIIQKLIDSLIYNDESRLKFNSDELLSVLFILGVFRNKEFIRLKKSCTNQFIQSLTIENISVMQEQVKLYLSQCRDNHLDNYILDHLNNYIESKEEFSQPNLIYLDETVEIEPLDIGKLYNDKRTSDLKIQIGEDNYLYCHKTILSSSSALFCAMFDSGSTFTDLSNDNVFIPDSSDDLELLEIIIRTCYEIPLEDVKYEKLISLLDMAMKHEMEYLVKYCKSAMMISIDNYFEIVSACENYFGLQCFECFYDELARFATLHIAELFLNCHISKLPPKLQVIFLKYTQEMVSSSFLQKIQ